MTIKNHEMARRGAIGGFTTASRHDTREITQPARDGFLRRFLFQVDPNNELAPEERERRAVAARRAHMRRLARLSALKRAGTAPVRRPHRRTGGTPPN